MKTPQLLYVFAVLVLGFSQGTARAGVVLSDNLTQPLGGGATFGVDSTTLGAQSFNSGEYTTLSLVKLNLYGGNEGYTFDVELWDSTGADGRPGAFVMTLGNDMPNPTVGDSGNVVTISDLVTEVTASTDYYIVLRPNAGSVVTWGYSSSTGGTGFPSSYSFSNVDGPPSWEIPDLTAPQRMYIEASPVPEPSTWLAAGFIGLLVVGHFGRARFARLAGRG